MWGRIGLTGAVLAAALMANASPAQADTAEVITQRWNSRSFAPQVTATVSQICPSTTPYLKSASVWQNSKSHEAVYLTRYDKFTVSADNRSAGITVTNTQTYAEAAAHPVDVSVKITITCSNIDPHQTVQPTLTTRLIVPTGGEFSYMTCPPGFSAVSASETHADWVRSRGVEKGGRSAWVLWDNDTFVMGWAELTVFCAQ